MGMKLFISILALLAIGAFAEHSQSDRIEKGTECGSVPQRA